VIYEDLEGNYQIEKIEAALSKQFKYAA